MKLLFDLFPVIVFFVAFKLHGIYAATGATICASILQTSWFWFKNRRFDFLLLATSGIVIVLGITTLLLHDEIYIKWKPTAISWAFATAFFVSQFVGKKPLIRHVLEAVVKQVDEDIEMPHQVWNTLNNVWILFYLFLGGANLFVVYNFDTNIWVYFKLFGLLGLTVVFIILQSLFIVKYLDNPKGNSDNE